MFMHLLLGSFAMLILCPFILAVVAYPLFAVLGGYSSHVRHTPQLSGDAWKQVNMEEAKAHT
jgi:hypothetical protein